MADQDSSQSALLSDPPIVIRGGSVKIKYKRSSFNHNGDEDDNQTATLDRLVINGGTPISLNQGDVIEIYYR